MEPAMGAPVSKPVIGVIGGIGGGKSLVAGMLAEHGGRLIEGDKLGHEALKRPEIREQVIGRWGVQVADSQGQIDRRRLGEIVFADAAERQALEKLVFPWIEKRIEEEIAKAEQSPEIKYAVLDAAILLEAGWDRFCDLVIYVEASREERLKRLAVQRGWSEKEVNLRENAQFPLDEKAARADIVVDNSGDMAHTRRQVEQFLRELPQLISNRTQNLVS